MDEELLTMRGTVIRQKQCWFERPALYWSKEARVMGWKEAESVQLLWGL